MSTGPVVLLTGGTGYLGGLLAAALLEHEHARLIVPLRSHRSPDAFWDPVRRELHACGVALSDSMRSRVSFVPMPALDEVGSLARSMAAHGVTEVLHCAGCLDYFDDERLNAVNVLLTRALVQLADRLQLERFLHISTAFSSGDADGRVPEDLLTDGRGDPTAYTRSKRRAEWEVAAGRTPWSIVRPPIVIGDSRDGRYHGPRYGLYQLWAGMERLFYETWQPEMSIVTAPWPLPMLHQDAFKTAVLGARTHLAACSVLNLVPPECPSLDDLVRAWFPSTLAPEVLHCYPDLRSVPMRTIDRRQRALLGATSTNLHIAARRWDYELGNTERLARAGVRWPATTLAGIGICQDRFVSASAKITGFREANRDRFRRATELVYHASTGPAADSRA